MPNSQPFFIVGVHRSGTTLLRFMLSSHPRLYIPPESDFIPHFFRKKPQEQLTRAQVAQFLQVIFSKYRFVEDWQGSTPDPESFFKQMNPLNPAGFLDQLYGQYAAQNGARRWGDKTPIYASYVDVLYAIFPQAQFVHILRDPFDAAFSLLDKYADREFHIDIYFAARNWVRRIQHIRTVSQKLSAENYLELRYENLVKNPEEELRRVCEFLEEDFVPRMLEQQKLAQKVVDSDSHFFDNVRKPVNTKSLGRGRSGLSERDRRLIQHVAGPLMLELDYPLDDLGPLPLTEKTRLAYLWAKYEILQAGRRTMTTLGLMPPI